MNVVKTALMNVHHSTKRGTQKYSPRKHQKITKMSVRGSSDAEKAQYVFLVAEEHRFTAKKVNLKTKY